MNSLSKGERKRGSTLIYILPVVCEGSSIYMCVQRRSAGLARQMIKHKLYYHFPLSFSRELVLVDNTFTQYRSGEVEHSHHVGILDSAEMRRTLVTSIYSYQVNHQSGWYIHIHVDGCETHAYGIALSGALRPSCHA